jgi:glycosyltransferase involved in cell wall biosynthesis
MQLTIIIPTCNRSVESLTRAIDSVINQQLSDFEIIIIDDSPRLNNKLKSLIVNKYSSYNLYYYINDGIHGVANARNLGVELAKGQYVTFLDDDDMYLPGRLVNMLSEMENKQNIFVSSGRFYEIGDFAEIHNVPYQYIGKIKLEDIKYANDIDIGFMVTRSDFLRIGGFDPSFTNLEDWDFVIRMLKEGNGYKLARLDYAVNIDPNRERVSTNDSKGYRELAQKYQQEFGLKWYLFMLAMADRLEKKLTLSQTIAYTFKVADKSVAIMYLKYKLQFLKKYFIK